MSSQNQRTFNPDAAFLAFLWPGLGHIRMGERKRGFLIMAGLLILVLGGGLIGGLDCVDARENRLWFLAQALNGPIVFAMDFANQRFVKPMEAENPFTRGLAHVNEMGTLFIALAGLMNLVAILDVLHYAPPTAPASAPPPTPRRRADDDAKLSASQSSANPGTGAGA